MAHTINAYDVLDYGRITIKNCTRAAVHDFIDRLLESESIDNAQKKLMIETIVGDLKSIATGVGFRRAHVRKSE